MVFLNMKTFLFSSVGNLTPEPPKISSSTSHPDLLSGWDSWADSSTTSSVASPQLKPVCEGIMKLNFSRLGQFNHLKLLNMSLCIFALLLKCSFNKTLV